MINFYRRKLHNLISDKKFFSILTGSVWALGARIIAAVIGLTTSIIIARAYGAEVLGILSLLQSSLMLATIFTILGTDTSILRLVPEHSVRYSPTSAFKIYRKSQYLVSGMSLIMGSLLFLVSGFLADTIFSKPHLHYYFALGALFIIFKSLMNLNTQAVRGAKMIRAFAFMQLLPSLSKLVILVPITIFFYNKNNPIYAMFASIAITALAGVWIMDRLFKKNAKSGDVICHMSIWKILTISVPMLLASTMFFIIGQTGVIMLGLFRTTAEVGYYSVAVSLSALTTFSATAITTIAAPKFSELYYTKNWYELFYIAKKTTKLMFWTSAPILLILIVFGKYILWGLYGKEYITAYSAIFFLTIGQFVSASSGATNTFMNMTGKQIAFRNIICSAAIINILLNYLLIPLMGITGSALAGMASTIFWNIASLIYIKKHFGKTIGYLPFQRNGKRF